MNRKTIYLIGSLRNETIPDISNAIEAATQFEVFDSWMSPGPEADEYLRKYELARGRTVEQALQGHAAKHIFEFDKYHIDRADVGVLVMPAGKSGHLELGYMIGQGKPGFILFDEEPTRIDVMWQFATKLCFHINTLIHELNKLK